jgi:hypothetical protein
MDYIKQIKKWKDFVAEAKSDPDGDMDANVRSILTKVAPDYLGESRSKIYGAAWKEYQKYWG